MIYGIQITRHQVIECYWSHKTYCEFCRIVIAIIIHIYEEVICSILHPGRDAVRGHEWTGGHCTCRWGPEQRRRQRQRGLPERRCGSGGPEWTQAGGQGGLGLAEPLHRLRQFRSRHRPGDRGDLGQKSSTGPGCLQRRSSLTLTVAGGLQGASFAQFQCCTGPLVYYKVIKICRRLERAPYLFIFPSLRINKC